MFPRWLQVATLAFAVGIACRAPDEERPRRGATRMVSQAAVPAPRFDPIRVEPLADDPSVFVLQGQPRGSGKLVFLHGMCGHGLGYAQSFQNSAAKFGRLIAPQADIRCGNGPWAKWSGDTAKLQERIERTFASLGDGTTLEDVCVLGYSQGATRAEALARAYPRVYSRLVLMAAPTPLNPAGLSHLVSALMMAGERDRRDLMKDSAERLKRRGVRASFMLIPEATHGSMGPTPEKTMGAALDWLWQAPEAAL